MATYEEWNKAIVEYVLQGQSRGSYIFLSIDDIALETIGLSFEVSAPNSWAEDFIQAVKDHCIWDEKLHIDHLKKIKNDSPQGVAFLALMVLATYRMGYAEEDAVVDPKAFFPHFNRLIGLNDDGRPLKGEEDLWKQWASWLKKKGFLPTAQAGEGSQKYINYPISQSLLRQSDRNKLIRLFSGAGNNSKWKKDLDERLLMAYLYRNKSLLTRHLQEILSPDKPFWQRAQDAITQACFEVYEDWREGTTHVTTSKTSLVRTTLDARIYREYDIYTGEPIYRLFAKQSSRLPEKLFANSQVEFDGQNFDLIPERGWFQAFGELKVSHLNRALKLNVKNSPITTIHLPNRKFWILTLDPELPESGIYANWSKGAELGTPFILLAHQDMGQDIENLKDEGLLKWRDRVSLNEDNQWYEYRDVQVLAEPRVWERLKQGATDDDLRLALRPTSTLGILFVDGIRAPEKEGWLIDYPPRIVINAFDDDIELEITDDTDNIVFQERVEPQKPIDIHWHETGVYTIKASQGGSTIEKIVRLVNLSSLSPKEVERKYPESNLLFFGAWSGER